MTTASKTPTYLDPNQPIAIRVADLIANMTVEEKISQLRNDAAAIPRLGIPAYNYWSEGLHGVARNGRATVFPQAIGLAATWDPALIERVASAIADEGRAKYHAALRRNGANGYCQGLTFWSPNVNIFRDPRWGRGQETYGEDPFLTGEIGSAFVRGLQGDHPVYLKAAACAKHYAVHSGPERLRHNFDARASLHDMHDTYLPAFKKLVTEAKVEAVMGAYNRTNGSPCCAHPYLMGDLLFAKWDFRGHFVSDCGAVSDIFHGHHTAGDLAEAAAIALKAGCDLECGDAYSHLGEALARGLVNEDDLDGALTRTYTTRFKLGMFDPDGLVPFAATPESVIGSPEHRHLAYTAALKSLVLLKNKGNLLPLSSEIRSIRLLGPAAADGNILLGNYYGVSEDLTTLLEGFAGRLPEGVALDYRQCVQYEQPSTAQVDWWLRPSDQPDVVIACMGLSPLMEGEEGDAIVASAEGDRGDIMLPAVQADYIRKLAANGTKIVLILAGGSPIALGDIEDLVDAILFVWYPGQAGGYAVADVVFGNAGPSGRLPITFPASVDQLPPFDDYSMVGRTYRYMEGEPLFPFGFGLSYTHFAYSALTLAEDVIHVGESMQTQVTVTNVGEVAGEEVVQVYLTDLSASEIDPMCKLVGFQRVALAPRESIIVEFEVTAESMMSVSDSGDWVLDPGEFLITMGACSPGQRGPALGAPQGVSAQFTVQ